MHFDLNELVQPVMHLDELISPFTNEVKNLPSGKSPSPDGFNTDFTKKYWVIIATDFYELYQGFYDSNICLQSINNSYIVLIPKI
jgi:hypothetical protein